MFNIDNENEEIEAYENVPIIRKTCAFCNRKFSEYTYDRHTQLCEKQMMHKRETFDSSKQRVIRSGNSLIKPKPFNIAEINKEKKSDWRKQHDKFIEDLRHSRAVLQALKQGKPLPPPKISELPDNYIKCGYCSRNFERNAGERHIPFCKSKFERVQNDMTFAQRIMPKTEVQLREEKRRNYRPMLSRKKNIQAGGIADTAKKSESVKPKAEIDGKTSVRFKLVNRKPDEPVNAAKDKTSLKSAEEKNNLKLSNGKMSQKNDQRTKSIQNRSLRYTNNRKSDIRSGTQKPATKTSNEMHAALNEEKDPIRNDNRSCMNFKNNSSEDAVFLKSVCKKKLDLISKNKANLRDILVSQTNSSASGDPAEIDKDIEEPDDESESDKFKSNSNSDDSDSTNSNTSEEDSTTLSHDEAPSSFCNDCGETFANDNVNYCSYCGKKRRK